MARSSSVPTERHALLLSKNPFTGTCEHVQSLHWKFGGWAKRAITLAPEDRGQRLGPIQK